MDIKVDEMKSEVDFGSSDLQTTFEDGLRRQGRLEPLRRTRQNLLL